MKKTFGGVWPAMVTPMTSDGQLAFPVLEQLVELFVQQGMDGIYVTGSTGQWPQLSLEERISVMDCVVKAAAGRIPVMAHIGAMTTADAVFLAQQAVRCGVDAVSSIAPTYYVHPEAAVFAHYRQIGQATDLPFFAYHLSVASSTSINPKRYAEQLQSIPNLAGMKITDLNLYLFGLIQAGTGGKLQLFSGADEVLCQAVVSGAVGAIGTFYNLWGPECQQARRAMIEGQIPSATRFMLRFQSALSQILESGSVYGFLREAMKLKYNLDIGMPRPPLGVTDKSWGESRVREIIDLVESH